MALILGALADLAATLLSRLVGRPHRPWARRWRDLRALPRADPAGRASVPEAAGGAAAILGGGMAAAAALGGIPGTAPLVYLALVLGAVGVGLASGSFRDPSWRAAAEPAFLVALGAGFLRWGTFDLEAVRGAQDVLGPGVAVGPPLALAAGIAASVVLLVAGSFRLGPMAPDPEPAAAAVLAAAGRWAVAGGTILVAAVLVAGADPLGSPGGLMVFGAASLAGALVMGTADALLQDVSPAPRVIAVGLSVLLAGGAVAAVVA